MSRSRMRRATRPSSSAWASAAEGEPHANGAPDFGVPSSRPGDGAAEALYPMREPRVLAGSQAAGVRPAARRLADDGPDWRAAWAAGFRILNSYRMKKDV